MVLLGYWYHDEGVLRFAYLPYKWPFMFSHYSLLVCFSFNDLSPSFTYALDHAFTYGYLRNLNYACVYKVRLDSCEGCAMMEKCLLSYMWLRMNWMMMIIMMITFLFCLRVLDHMEGLNTLWFGLEIISTRENLAFWQWIFWWGEDGFMRPNTLRWCDHLTLTLELVIILLGFDAIYVWYMMNLMQRTLEELMLTNLYTFD